MFAEPARTHSSRRIEATRAVAALAVVVYHVQVATHGYNGDWAALSPAARLAMYGSFGVDVFFVLSGYLLYRPFLRAASAARTVDLRRYARNRVLRVLPLYYAAVAILLILQPGGATWDQAWRHVVFAQNLSTGTRLLDGPLWSLVCEVQFYALLPVIAFCVLRPAGRSSRRALLGTALLAAAAAWLASTVLGLQPFAVWGLSLPANLVAFAAGMLLAALEFHLRQGGTSLLRSRATLVLLSLGAAGAWVAQYPGPTRFGVLAASALTVAAVVAADSVLPVRTRRVGPLAAVGVASYSLYVWHLPVIGRLVAAGVLGSNTLTNALVAVPACVALALVSYRCVEVPFLRRQRPSVERGAAPSTPLDLTAADHLERAAGHRLHLVEVAVVPSRIG